MRSDEAIWAAAAAVVTVLWVVAALVGGDPAPVDTTAVGAAAAAGTAAAVGAAWGSGSIKPVWLAGLTLVVLPVATASAAGGSAPVLPVVLLVLVAGEVVSSLSNPGGHGDGGTGQAREGETSPEEVWARAGLVLLATGMLVAAVASGREGSEDWRLVADGGAASAFGLAAAAVLLGAAALGPPPGRAYAGPGLLAGLIVAPGVSSLTLAIIGGALALLSAALLGRRPGVALGFLGLGAAAFSAGRPAAALLLAGAALALSYGADHPAAGLLGLPGAAALTMDALTAGGGAVPIVLVAAMVATAALLVLAATGVTRSIQLAPVRVIEAEYLPWAAIPAAALGTWLLVAPGTWTWTGASGLGAYDRGAAAAAAVGCSVVVLKAATRLRDPQQTSSGAVSGWSQPNGGRTVG
jgi:hypothetical protein